MKKFLLSTLYSLLSTVLIACAPTRMAIKRGYDFSQIKIIGVSEFAGEGESGKMVREEFIRQLLKKEVRVKTISETGPQWEEKKHEIDVLLTGTVTRYLPERKFLVYLGEKTTDQKILVSPSTEIKILVGTPLTEISGTSTYTWGRIAGLEGSQILITNATIGIAAKMVEIKSGEVIWADSYSYEGLDVQTATENVVRYFLHSLRKYWKQLH